MSDEQKPPLHIHVNVDGQEIASFVTGKQQPLDQSTISYWNDINNHIQGTTVIDHSDIEKKGDQTNG